MSYNVPIQRRQGGTSMVVASNGTLQIASGGTLQISSGGMIVGSNGSQAGSIASVATTYTLSAAYNSTQLISAMSAIAVGLNALVTAGRHAGLIATS